MFLILFIFSVCGWPQSDFGSSLLKAVYCSTSPHDSKEMQIVRLKTASDSV